MNGLVAGIAPILLSVGTALQGVQFAFNAAFTQGEADAIIAIQKIRNQQQMAIFLSFGTALQGVAVAFNLAFTTATNDGSWYIEYFWRICC